MDEWIDYYDSTHTIYASKLHRDVHFEVIANDIIGYIPSPDAVVLDYACGEALSAARVASACGKLILAEPAPGVRGRLIARFAPNTKIRVRSLDELRGMIEIWMRCRCRSSKAKRQSTTTASGIRPWPAHFSSIQ